MWTLLFGVILFILSILLILCQLNHKVQYCVKFAVYYTIVSLFAIVVLPLFFFSPGDPNNFRYMITTFKICGLLLGMKWKLKGLQNLKCNRPYILVSNHQSSLDFIGACEMIPHRTTFLAKKEIFYAGPFGLACWLCGTIFIDRGRHNSAVQTMSSAAKIIHKKDCIVWIFPEGRRNPSKQMLPFKRGAFYLAVQAQVPVVPVVFSPYTFYDKKNKRLDSGTFNITALPPVPTVGLTENDVPALTEKVREQMVRVFTEP